MKAKPIYLDFLNREASRAVGRERPQETDLDILRTLCLTLPYGFSSNISQLAEYGNERTQLFETIMKLISAGIIDATSSAGTIDEFIGDHQERYSHVPHRYPFYFSRSAELQKVRLGTRNEFSMTKSLGQHLINYEPSRFQFDLLRASNHDQNVFESGHDALVKKIMDRENLAITRDLLETNRGGITMNSQQIATTSRIFSALYMKIYADQRGLATCTGIPDFSYKEVISNFPSFDYPILRRAICSLGGTHFLTNSKIETIISGYRTVTHQHFAYYLEGYLESVYETIKSRANHPNSLSSLRSLFEQFFVRELDDQKIIASDDIHNFFRDSTFRLLESGGRVAVRDQEFSKKWREYVPESTKNLIVITTATDREDTALFSALEQNGFKRSKIINIGRSVAQEFSLDYLQRLVHVRTRAGSLGVNSAGGVLAPAINSLNADFVISAGLCFGLKPKKYKFGEQEFGDVLIASDIQDYETNRQGVDEIRVRGDKLPAGPGLLAAARIAKDQTDRTNFNVFEGTILSGQKLVDDPSFVERLRERFPEAIGGEMEGNALATAAIYEGRQWILIKAICDWGMEKEDVSQNLAAERACQLAVKTAQILMTSE